MKIEYPTIIKEGELNEAEKQDQVAKYFGHQNSLGFFLIGRLNTWHGGIHIEGTKKEVKALADGRVIAYRITENYCSIQEGESEQKFSNNFVLMQHNYKSPKEQKFRFYSLYMHLMPKVQLEEKNIVPDIFGKYSGKVTGDESLSGLNARSGSKTVTGKKLGVIKTVIPVGAIVYHDPLPSEPSNVDKLLADLNDYSDEIVPIPNRLPSQFDFNQKRYWVAKKKLQDVIDNHWSNDEINKKYRYSRVCYGEWIDIYIATSNGRVKDLGNGKLQIVTVEDTITTYDKSAPKGAVVYDKPNNTGQGKYLRTEAKNTDLGELEKVNEKWFKIPGKEEYIAASALDITKTVHESIALNDVQNVDIKIKAGTTLGYSGTYALKNRSSYSAVHLEVFTDDAAVKDFIVNKTGDDNRNQYQVPANKPLQIGKPVNDLKKDTKVKIYAYKGGYVQIGFENIEKLIKYSKLTWDDSKKRYTINADALAEINANSEYKYTETDELKFAGYRDKDGNKVSENSATHRNTLIENSRAGQKYWIKSDVVPSLDVLQPMQAMQPIGVSGIQTGAQGTTAQATSPNNTVEESNNFEPCWVKLTADVDVIYDTEPNDQNTADISINAIMQVQRKIATATDNNGDKWYKIKGQYFEADLKKSVEGWIKEKELTVINPYNWTEFNWQLKEDTGNQYIYQFNANEGETPHDFIKTIWKEVDTNGDKVLTLFELQNAMRSEQKVNILSKLICKHQSEWDTWQNMDTFEREIMALYQKGIDQEDYPEEKQQLEQARDERISQLKEKIEKLCFWGDVRDGDVRELEEDEPSRTFPSDSNVYHFHPIAFVEQMKMITAPTMPPWMEIAIEKAIMAGGAHESQEPLYSFAKKCLELGGSKARPDDNTYGQWCGAFVSWCLNKSNFKVAPNIWERLRSQSFISLEGEIYKKIDSPVVGCIVVMTNYKTSDGAPNGSGHVTMLYGVDGDNLVCLGGNQGSKLKCSNYKRNGISYKGKKFEQRFNTFLMPISYPESYYNYNVPTITVDEANKKLGINLKSKKNESTF